MSDSRVQPSRSTTGSCNLCGETLELAPLEPGWVPTPKPRSAWVCPDCVRAGRQPGDPLPPRP